MLYIDRATVFTPHRRIEEGALLTDGAQIVAVGPADDVPRPPGAQVIDASGLFLTPGFIELQINGAFGHDFTADPTTLWAVAAGLPRYGVTAFLPTVITSPLETIAAAREVVAQGAPGGTAGAIPLGLHVEGPFLNPQKKGAHNAAYLRPPDPEVIARCRDWTPESGVRLVTLAPELPGALEWVRTLAGRGVVVSSGHSMATYAEALAGFDAGTRYGTHLFNAMPALHHREPGLIGALLTDERPTVGLIVDGIHVHPAAVQMAWEILGKERLSLVTDAMAAQGMPPGQYLLGDYEVVVDESSARLVDGTLAGSILSLDAALRNLIAFTGCSFREALPTVTTVPAALLGIDDLRGRLAPGLVADLALLTPDLEVITTIVGGRVVYTRDS